MSSIDISASGLTAQRLRLDLIATNLANAETTRTDNGGPFQRLQAVLRESEEQAGVVVTEVAPDSRPPRLIHQPGHPDADAQGMVQMPNIDPVEEMVDLVSATRAYEANVTALNASKSMTRKALEIGRG